MKQYTCVEFRHMDMSVIVNVEVPASVYPYFFPPEHS